MSTSFRQHQHQDRQGGMSQRDHRNQNQQNQGRNNGYSRPPQHQPAPIARSNGYQPISNRPVPAKPRDIYRAPQPPQPQFQRDDRPRTPPPPLMTKILPSQVQNHYSRLNVPDHATEGVYFGINENGKDFIQIDFKNGYYDVWEFVNDTSPGARFPRCWQITEAGEWSDNDGDKPSWSASWSAVPSAPSSATGTDADPADQRSEDDEYEDEETTGNRL